MIIKINNVQSQVITGGKDNLLPFSISDKLKEYLRVRPNGYRYSDAFKRRGWDGYKYFINNSGVFATGYLPMVLKYLDSLDIPEVIIEDERINMVRFKEEFVSDINVWDVREYQAGMVQKANNYLEFRGQSIYFPRGIFDCATNSGKNSIMAGIVMNAVNPRVLMTIHSVDIFRQAVKFFSKVFGEHNIGLVDSKNYKLGMFTIAMNKTLLNRMKESINVRQDMQEFNILFTDESHRVGKGEYGELIAGINNAAARYFVSGTPLDSEDPVKKLVCVGLSGSVLGTITNEEMINSGVSLKPTIHFLLNKPVIKQVSFDYESEYDDRVMFSKERVNILLDFLSKNKGYTLIAFNEKRHGEYLLKAFLDDYRFTSCKIDMVHGQDKNREQKLASFEVGNIDILICSKIAEAGLNLPLMNIMVYGIGGMNKTAIKQFVGRLIRDDGVSDGCKVVDFYDLGNWVEKHSRKRLSIYKAEKFDIEYYYPNKRGYYAGD